MDTFCVLPWFGQEISWDQNRLTHCCLLPKNHDIKKIRQEMLGGKRPTECKKCWTLEDQGFTSDRQLKNAALDWYWDRDLELIKQDAAAGVHNPLMLKLWTSNLCNGTCISCGPEVSSSWAALRSKIDKTIPIQKYESVDIAQLTTTINFSDLKTLILIGGEPLLERKNFLVLEKLLDQGNDQCFISLTTNGSVALTPQYKKILEKFKNLNFCISIDGTGPVFEYLRFPLKWDKLQENLEFFRNLTDLVSANYTLSNLNILYHNQTVDWFNSQKMSYSINPVYNPTWLMPRVLPESVKHRLKSILNDEDYSAYIGVHDESDDKNFQEFCQQIMVQDCAKKIDIKNYLPELYHLIADDFRSE